MHSAHLVEELLRFGKTPAFAWITGRDLRGILGDAINAARNPWQANWNVGEHKHPAPHITQFLNLCTIGIDNISNVDCHTHMSRMPVTKTSTIWANMCSLGTVPWRRTVALQGPNKNNHVHPITQDYSGLPGLPRTARIKISEYQHLSTTTYHGLQADALPKFLCFVHLMGRAISLSQWPWGNTCPWKHHQFHQIPTENYLGRTNQMAS